VDKFLPMNNPIAASCEVCAVVFRSIVANSLPKRLVSVILAGPLFVRGARVCKLRPLRNLKQDA
jgi:hypothetical protein